MITKYETLIILASITETSGIWKKIQEVLDIHDDGDFD